MTRETERLIEGLLREVAIGHAAMAIRGAACDAFDAWKEAQASGMDRESILTADPFQQLLDLIQVPS